MSQKWIIGIDEVGRGPLAGPVTVCALAIRQMAKQKNGHSMSILLGLDKLGLSSFDSKKISPKKRELISKILHGMRQEENILFSISSVSAKQIDKLGIVTCVNLAIIRSLKSLDSQLRGKATKLVEVLLDGGLCAPKEYKNQETVIHGDAKVPVIGLASVLAKVHRDRIMTNLGVKHLSWGFEKHKGYGTKLHYEKINEHGITPIHRRSYLKSLAVRQA